MANRAPDRDRCNEAVTSRCTALRQPGHSRCIGDISLAACAQSVAQMLPACSAVAQLASLKATRLGEFATACRDICDDCEKECRKHAAIHAVCKACADSCAQFVAEAKRLTVA